MANEPNDSLKTPAVVVFLALAAAVVVACSPEKPEPPPPPIEEQIARLKEIQSRHVNDVLALPGVMGMCIGEAEEAGFGFSVLVDRSQPEPELPGEIEGVAVRARLRDPIQLLNGAPGCGGSNNECHNNQLPLPVEMGNSGGWASLTAGGPCSLGFKACDLGTGKVVFVSNSHCNQNPVTCGFPNLSLPNGRRWIHPGRDDVPENQATCEMDDTCTTIGQITGIEAPSCNSDSNIVDASKVESSTAQTANTFRDVGYAQAGPANVMPDDPVQKSGRTTGHTTGRVQLVSCSINVPDKGFCCGPLTMHDQIEWLPDNPLTPGDSGSALLTNEDVVRVAGLNWGSGGSVAYANRIDNVLEALDLSLNFVSCFEDCVFTAMASASPDPETTIALGHRFREGVLEKSPRGRQYTSIYYQVTDEAMRLIGADLGLLKRTVEFFRRYRGVVDDLASGVKVELADTDIEAVDRLLEEYQRAGSPMLGEALEILRKDLRDPKVLAEFGAQVGYGK